ncbi:MAG: Rieske 2Fe-2S domain-containing protein [Desertifilum sp. SIO1I2]|nr:Rieske 2Fe-2S domain-containing protein [Desertifilum sp. SIO1I2]
MTVAIERETATLPAGGNDPTRFNCKEVWYPVHYIEDLDKTKPTPFTLLGEDLVLWWDKQAECWRAFADRCPHRLAPLSQGRVNEAGCLECPYHGWEFGGTGECKSIPQQRETRRGELSPRSKVRSLPTTVRQGLLFVYPGQPENAEKVCVPIVDVLEDTSSEWVCLNTFRDLPYDALTLLENVLDSSHVPFTHHKSVGNRSNAGPVDLEVVEADKQGFRGIWEEGPRRGTLGRQESTFIAPNLMWHDLTSKQFGRTLTVVYATPIRKGECRLFARFPFKFPSPIPRLIIGLTPRWYSHLGQNAVLEDDQIFLHYQERYLEAVGGGGNYAKACYLPTKADNFVLAFRQWVNEYQADPFPGERLPPALSQAQLLDRYTSHTTHCASCRQALANIQRLQWLSVGVGAIAWLLVPLLGFGFSHLWGSIASGGIFILATGTAFGLNRLQQRFYQGREIPPRNLPEKSQVQSG